MSLDFESDISPKIRFLVDLGIRPEDLGYIFTYNPDFFKLDPGKKIISHIKAQHNIFFIIALSLLTLIFVTQGCETYLINAFLC